MQVEAVEHAVKTDQQTRRKIFEEEIDMIAHEEVKQFLLKAIDLLPEYFWYEKHIPTYYNATDKNQTVVEHTKDVVALVNELLTAYDASDILRDIVLVAAILHEGWVRGEIYSESIDPFYPLYPRRMLSKKQYNLIVPEAIWRGITDTIEGHLGEFSPNPKLNPPKGGPSYLLHLADYLCDNRIVSIN